MVALSSLATPFPAGLDPGPSDSLVPRLGFGPSEGPGFRVRPLGERRPGDPIFPDAPAIYPWLDAAFREGAATALVGPGAQVARFLPFLMASVVATGQEVALREGANRFSPYELAAMGRRLGVPARDALARVRLARAFTAYQMVALIEQWADDLAAREPLPSLLVVSDPGVLFEAEELLPDEREALQRHLAARLRRLLRTTRCPLLLTQEGPGLRMPGWAEAGPPLHELLRVAPGAAGSTFLVAERRASSVELVTVPTLQHRLEEFDARSGGTGGPPGGSSWDGPYPRTVRR